MFFSAKTRVRTPRKQYNQARFARRREWSAGVRRGRAFSGSRASRSLLPLDAEASRIRRSRCVYTASVPIYTREHMYTHKERRAAANASARARAFCHAAINNGKPIISICSNDAISDSRFRTGLLSAPIKRKRGTRS